MTQVKRYAIAEFGLLALLSIACFAQESSWRTEHYDSLLIAPGATEVKYVESGGLHELTYIVEEPYPASKAVNFICEEMRRKGWGEPLKHAGDGWMETYIPGKPHPYRWEAWWGRNKKEQVTYTLDYLEDNSRHYLKILHVRAVYNSQVFDADEHLRQVQAEALKNRAPEEFEWPTDLTVLLAILLFVPPLAIASTEARRFVFYRGPNTWLIKTNLCLFGAVLTPVLLFGALLISVIFGKEGMLVAGIAGWVVMAHLARVSYVACAAVFLLAVGILRAEKIPKNVKMTHIALSVAAFSFFVLCIHFFSGPLIRW
jgi:hypothetical protein